MFTTLTLSSLFVTFVVSQDICTAPALQPASYKAAATQYPSFAPAIEMLMKNPITFWYTDRNGDDAAKAIKTGISECKGVPPVIAVYGLPYKDCDAGFSSGGLNSVGTPDNTADATEAAANYKQFITTLKASLGDSEAIIIMEPDALGLLGKAECAKSSHYEENLLMALGILATTKARIYLDLGYWLITDENELPKVATALKPFKNHTNVKGITLNTSNYQTTEYMEELCAKYKQAAADTSINCIIDTSHNFKGPTATNEWCNPEGRGIGAPPKKSTAANIDYEIWVKPPGESDGTCTGRADSMKGPDAGKFFPEHFVQLWNNGYYVAEGLSPQVSMDGIAGNSTTPSTPTPGNTTPSPATPSTPTPGNTTPPPSTPAPPGNETPGTAAPCRRKLRQ